MKTINIQSPVGVVLLQSFVSPGVYRLDEHNPCWYKLKYFIGLSHLSPLFI